VPTECEWRMSSAARARVFPEQHRPDSRHEVLYTCALHIPGDAQPGSYPITCSSPGASDSFGHSLPIDCTEGSVTVKAPPLQVQAASSAQSGGGCAIRHEPARPVELIALIGIAVAFWCARRRSS
jgi:hypothetical protein